MAIPIITLLSSWASATGPCVAGSRPSGRPATFRTEWIDTGYATEERARMEVFKYIETFYNPIRRHSALGYLSPAEYERRYEAGQLTPMDEAA